MEDHQRDDERVEPTTGDSKRDPAPDTAGTGGPVDGDGGAAAHAGVKEGVVFTDDQLAAISTLASENTYAKQSKWRTFRELPAKDKWPFFVQHFLVATVAIVAAVVFVVAFAVTWATKSPDPKLYIAGVNVDTSLDEPMQSLERSFVKQSGLDAELVTYDGNFTLTEDGTAGGSMMDDSSRLFTMVAAGQINTLVCTADEFEDLNGRGLVSKLSDVLTKAQVRSLREAGVTIDGEASDAQGGGTAAMGLDLSRSSVWAGTKGLPSGMVLAFANVTDTGTDYPRAFVDFLDFS